MRLNLLCSDFETSGLDIRENKHQPISCGAIILDGLTLETKAEIYIETQFHADRFEWGQKAEEIHGLTREHLSTKPTMGEGAMKFVEFCLPYFKQTDPITLLGHNPHFDMRCLELWMDEIDLHMTFGHRRLDTFSLGFGLFGAVNSEQLFNRVGVKRSTHNALEDARATVAALRMSRKIGDIYLELLKEHEEGKL